MCAVTSGAVDIVELLLRRGANPFLDRVSLLFYQEFHFQTICYLYAYHFIGIE